MLVDNFFGMLVAVWMIEKIGSRCCLRLHSRHPQHWYNTALFIWAHHCATSSQGFILYRRCIDYIGKSSCFSPPIKSTIGATVGCIGYHSFGWDVQDDIMQKG